MNSISFQIPLKPISLNTSHRNVRFGKRLARIKTPETIQFEEKFLYHLSEVGHLKKNITDHYDPRMHSLEVEAFFYLNENDFFTKPKKGSKTISQKSIDLDNMIKVSLDQIFRWLSIDDSQVTKISAEKIATNNDATMVFRITLIKIPEIFRVD